MKLSLNDLKEQTSINLTVDYSNYIKDFNDIKSIDLTLIVGQSSYQLGELKLNLNIRTKLELLCSKTLKPVSYDMNFDTEIIFGESEESDYYLEEANNLTDIIFGYIISEKPYTIYHPDAKETSFDQERSAHPAFAELDKIYKK
jgi:uncharacterized metal-binding protein YceD (DUF177 family)